MKCKFEVVSITKFSGFPSTKVEMIPTMGRGEEDKNLWKTVSNAKIELFINSPKDAIYFEVGKEYYVEFSS